MLLHIFVQRRLLDALLPVSYTEEWRLQDIYVSCPDQFWEELQEERDHQQSDVHAIDIGIGCHNHLIVTQAINAVFDVQGCLQKVELLVLIHHLLRQTVRVQRFSSQGEHSLRHHIAALRDASAG